jgi:endonuclease/exonuclease/phosphatase family metal-dependent hydrolase
MRRRLFVLLGLALLAAAAIVWRGCQPAQEHLPVTAVAGEPAPAGVLRVMTLNLAHGRAAAFNQALLPRNRIAENLTHVAEVLAREQPELVALQEADGPSLWSGHFDHVQSLADAAGFAARFRGQHVRGVGPLRLDYGTALLARTPLVRPESRVFRKAAWDTKGFVRATVRPTALGGAALEVISVHLDFASAEVRAAQVEDLIAALRPLPPPRLVMGDFNCDLDEPGCITALAAALDLVVIAPAGETPTFPSDAPRLRIDWILASPGFAVRAQRVLPDILSDHCAVLAELVPLSPATPADSR